MGNVLETILRKQAEFANLEYDKLDKNKWTEYEWTEDQEVDFYNWMTDYVYSLKKKDLPQIAQHPSLVYKKRKKIGLLAYQFIFQYGFTTSKLPPE